MEAAAGAAAQRAAARACGAALVLHRRPRGARARRAARRSGQATDRRSLDAAQLLLSARSRARGVLATRRSAGRSPAFPQVSTMTKRNYLLLLCVLLAADAAAQIRETPIGDNSERHISSDQTFMQWMKDPAVLE